MLSLLYPNDQRHSFVFVLMKALESAPSRYDRGMRWLTLGTLDHAYDWLAAHIRSGEHVLDLGCGTGALTLRAAARGAKVTAIDANPRMLAIARRRAQEASLAERITFRERSIGQLDDLPSFDAILAGLVLSELGIEILPYALDTCRHLLRPGGRLLLCDEVWPATSWLRALVAALRAPLAAVTWLLTQQTSHPLDNLETQLQAAGFSLGAQRRYALGMLLALVAERPEEVP